MATILIVNCKPRRCGVYQFGWNLHGALSTPYDCCVASSCTDGGYQSFRGKCGKHTLLYEACGHEPRFLDEADLVIWNHHPATMGWLNSSITDKKPSLLIVHDTIYPWSKQTFYLHCDPTFQEDERHLRIGRPVPKPLMVQPEVIPNSIGSFGFGFPNKGFEDLVLRVNEEYDEAIIRLNIPYNDSVDGDGVNAFLTAQRCFSLAKPGISCYITHDYLGERDLLFWLAQNEVNAFLYKDNDSKGLASAVDWAIAARRPFAVSGLQMFRHVHNVAPANKSLKQTVADGIEPFTPLYWVCEQQALLYDLERIIKRVLG